jgi:hypothetical protein
MDSQRGKDWRELCAEAAEEPDSERVASLVNQILQAFDDVDDECGRKAASSAHRTNTSK